MGIQNASTIKSNNPIIFFMATKIRKVESKTKKLVSFFAETEYLHGSKSRKDSAEFRLCEEKTNPLLTKHKDTKAQSL